MIFEKESVGIRLAMRKSGAAKSKPGKMAWNTSG